MAPQFRKTDNMEMEILHNVGRNGIIIISLRAISKYDKTFFYFKCLYSDPGNFAFSN